MLIRSGGSGSSKWVAKYPDFNKDGTRKTPIKSTTIKTIAPQNYDPKKHFLVEPDAAYSYNQGRQAGTLSPNFNIRSIQAPKSYRKEIRQASTQPPQARVPLNDNTRQILSQMQLQQPWINKNLFSRMVPQLQQSGQMPLGMQMPINGNDPIEAIAYAIGQIESTGNYGATNFNDPGGGAWGKYQILASNIPSWTQEALGYSMTPQQFIANPEAQDITAKYMMEKYYNQFGQDPLAVARAWNAGPGYATNPNAVPEYQSRFQQAYGNFNSTGQYQGPNAIATMGGQQGQFLQPLQGYGPNNNTFGKPNSRYASGRHRGQDYSAPLGTPVAAITGGKVLEAGFNGAWGNTLLMADSTGRYTVRYSHLNNINAAVGQQLGPGQILGAVGSTGRSTGAHLDLEVTRDGQLIDPLSLWR
jgi:hypothetical protein